MEKINVYSPETYTGQDGKQRDKRDVFHTAETFLLPKDINTENVLDFDYKYNQILT